MTAKIFAFISTLLINTAVAVIILLGMLVAMNGYSEGDATWGLGAFILLALVVIILTSTVALLIFNSFVKRGFSAAVSILAAVLISSVIGPLLEIISSLIGVGVAEFVRVNF